MNVLLSTYQSRDKLAKSRKRYVIINYELINQSINQTINQSVLLSTWELKRYILLSMKHDV